MVQQNEPREILAAWRALSDAEQERDGWRTIPLTGGARAGRHFPGNHESLLVGFAGIVIPPANQLPQGQGFVVSGVEIPDSCDKSWIALSRRPEGNLDMFATMALDVLDALRFSSSTSPESTFHIFLSRIRAWQDFMRRGTDSMLGPQAEIGLFGELVTILSSVHAGLHPSKPIEGWEGPLHGIQDIVLGTGAIEVKTTIATKGFPAIIESLDQLDDATRQPLFLAAVRLCPDDHATSLPETITQIRALIGDDPARHMFNTKLVHAGYIDASAEQYKRRFATVEVRILSLTGDFPRLTRAIVPPGIRDARYELDLDRVVAPTMNIEGALAMLGVL